MCACAAAHVSSLPVTYSGPVESSGKGCGATHTRATITEEISWGLKKISWRLRRLTIPYFQSTCTPVNYPYQSDTTSVHVDVFSVDVLSAGQRRADWAIVTVASPQRFAPTWRDAHTQTLSHTCRERYHFMREMTSSELSFHRHGKVAILSRCSFAS